MVSKLRGGKRTVKEVKEFINASYDENPPEKIGDFILDKNLTTSTGKVYYNPQTREAVVVHRGTQGGADWSNNLAYLSGTYESTDRYKQGKKVQDEAEKKYGAKNISTLSHSQGSVLARKLGANTKEIINLNPAYKGEQELPNEYNIRSKSDVVSGILGVKQYLNPSKNVTTIESKSSFEPLGEHSPDILDRLEGEIGGLRNKISTNNMKRAGRLNYTGEDINWYDGGILPVSAYQNIGKTQYGVIGGGHYESDSESDSESDEEMIGGDFFGSISKAFKPVSKAVTKTTQSIGKSLKPVTSGISKATGKLSKATDKINPLTYAFKDKGFNKLGVQSGEVTQDYLLPAVVQAGKPVYDASAMTASTMLTGNPILGKVAGDALWNTMAQPYDPRERQKSQILGEVASTAGKVLASQTKADLAEAVAKKGAKEASGKGRRGGMKKPKSLLDISFDKLSASDKKEYLKGVKEGVLIPPTFPFVRQMSEREYLDNRTQYNRDKYPHLYEGVNRLDGTGRKMKGGVRRLVGWAETVGTGEVDLLFSNDLRDAELDEIQIYELLQLNQTGRVQLDNNQIQDLQTALRQIARRQELLGRLNRSRKPPPTPKILKRGGRKMKGGMNNDDDELSNIFGDLSVSVRGSDRGRDQQSIIPQVEPPPPPLIGRRRREEEEEEEKEEPNKKANTKLDKVTGKRGKGRKKKVVL